MAVNHDIIINQGSDYIEQFVLVGTDGSVVFANGYVFTSQMRTSYVTANAVANINVSLTDEMNGVCTIYIPAASSANIPAGRYVYDIVQYDTANITTRIVSGIATISPQATWQMNTSPPQPF